MKAIGVYRWIWPAVLFLQVWWAVRGEAQNPCAQGSRLEGQIVDPAGAAIPGARLTWNSQETVRPQEIVISDAGGHYVFSCIRQRSGVLSAEAQGFEAWKQAVSLSAGAVVPMNVTLAISSVETNVQVNADSSTDAMNSTDTISFNTDEIKQLPDDPDDLLAELRMFASQLGGDPSAARILVDGFQNAGTMPPKSAIASIRINPDLFSAEYQWPPYSGGVIQITTKPGMSTWHGSAFVVGSPSATNATDPFSLSPTPASRIRYGGDLSGTLLPRRADLAFALEKRDIHEFAVVNAQTLGPAGVAVPFSQAVAVPQHLWIGSLRNGWQVSSNDTGFVSFAGNLNQTDNFGVGGLVLPEAGYSSRISQYDLRGSNTQTFGANLVHRSRVGFTWKRTLNTPNSTATSMQVAGYFTGGGAIGQNRDDRENDLEVDDDVMLTHGKTTLTFGVQSLGFFVHDQNPNTFNGEFIFGGGSAPVLDAQNQPTGQTTTITSLEQYRRALAGLSGGTPTVYQVNTGDPLVNFTQWNVALFAEDSVHLSPQLTVSAGLRQQMQTAPTSLTNFDPRIGLDWVLNKKATWSFHFHVGFFGDPNGVQAVSDTFRLNGVRQTQHNVYSPNFSAPLTPALGSIAVTTIDERSAHLVQKDIFNISAYLDHNFVQSWHVRVGFYLGQDADRPVWRNINAPLVTSSNNTAPDPTASLLAPRPYAPNENIVQYQSGGHLNGELGSVSVDQHAAKHFSFSLYYRHAHFKSDGGNGVGQAQSSYSSGGESSRADWLRSDSVSLTGTVKFPWKIEEGIQFDAASGAAYNIVTGTDDNGDGSFNDRPAYATAPGPGVYSTRYGLLTANAINGNLPRNAGTMPGVVHLATNLSRAFSLTADRNHPHTLTFNARAANLLNHTDVTAVNSVLSTTLGQPTVAEPARRIEFGTTFSF